VAAVVVACMSLPFQATQEEHSKTNTQRLLALRVSYLTFGSNDCYLSHLQFKLLLVISPCASKDCSQSEFA
jgi:hypothetical protein